jgi:hypothetical protein
MHTTTTSSEAVHCELNSLVRQQCEVEFDDARGREGGESVAVLPSQYGICVTE